MAQVLIGETTYNVPKLNFRALKSAWPYVEMTMEALSPMLAVEAGLRIISAGLACGNAFPRKPNEDFDEQVHRIFDHLQEEMGADQLKNVTGAIEDIMRESGLAPDAEPGEALAMVSPSTETSMPSSPNSSPLDAREAAGTA
jgi:hypothetical protein